MKVIQRYYPMVRMKCLSLWKNYNNKMFVFITVYTFIHFSSKTNFTMGTTSCRNSVQIYMLKQNWENLKKRTLPLDIKTGGCRMTNIETYIKSLKVAFNCYILKEFTKSAWNYLITKDTEICNKYMCQKGQNWAMLEKNMIFRREKKSIDKNKRHLKIWTRDLRFFNRYFIPCATMIYKPGRYK